MAEQFLSHDALVDRLHATSFDRPPALVANAHITGLGVARALTRHDVPVIALDRDPNGVATSSHAVDYAGAVTDPLSDLGAFRDEVAEIAAAIGDEPVAFACMDEWVNAFARAEPEGVTLPFADRGSIDALLDKESLYTLAEELGVPVPETYALHETDPEEVIEALGFPMVVKPAKKREGEEALGSNVIRVEDEEEFAEVVAAAREAEIRVLAQERVDVEVGEDRSLASYRAPDGEVLSVVGNARVRNPREFGTSSYVEVVEDPGLGAGARSLLSEAGYHGISESEFVYDRSREEYVLLDVNTRPWKWIGLPVAAGADLPTAAYGEATGTSFDPGETDDARWVYLPDYLRLLSTDRSFADLLSEADWRALASGSFEEDGTLTTGVYSPSDPGPIADVVRTEFTDRQYYCSC